MAYFFPYCGRHYINYTFWPIWHRYHIHGIFIFMFLWAFRAAIISMSWFGPFWVGLTVTTYFSLFGNSQCNQAHEQLIIPLASWDNVYNAQLIAAFCLLQGYIYSGIIYRSLSVYYQ